ncbi:thiamine pyrophosphate-binding protein [Pedococcus sp. 5OH_020]|uniref:thiamine pyrophosphate-binding protein n=1 Tax=Pedococcus sp. 5OH_020 TaxID=2989814 RepID=UPI0022E9AB0E|nr:thiamine pyrophosphate-binding protein [Pedococcus sp. 5OH_020]
MRDRVTGGAAVVDSLEAHGVRHVFGIPGTHSLELYRSLPGSGIRHIVTRHEQGAGYAADSYARVSGRPGVVFTTSGPGITNAVTALATAYADSVPVLAVSPGVPRGMVGADVGWLHEVKNQQAALDAVTARSIRVESADDIPDALADVFHGFASRRPRPVHLEVPVDVLEGPWCASPCPVREPTRPAAHPPSAGEPHVAAVVDALVASSRPALWLGGGARGAAASVAALADLGIPVVTTVAGKGILDETHGSSLGAAARLAGAHRLVNDADLLIVVGSEVGDSDTWGGTLAPGRAGERTVVRIDLDPAQLAKNLVADLTVQGDAAEVLAEVARAAGTARPDGWDRDRGKQARVTLDAEAAELGAPWEPIQRVLSEALPPETVVAGDSSQVTYLGTVHTWPMGPRGRLVYPTGYATLGYGLPAAIGAKVAQPERPVVALFGDGAAMFSIQELMTAVEQRLPIPVVVVDNGGYAEIREQMVDRDITPQAVDLVGPDFPALARAMGAAGVAAPSVESLADLVPAALVADRPTLVHLRHG